MKMPYNEFHSQISQGPNFLGTKAVRGPNEIGDYSVTASKIRYNTFDFLITILKTLSAHSKKIVKLQQSISLNVNKHLISDDYG